MRGDVVVKKSRPIELSGRAAELYDDLTEAYELDAHDAAVMVEACRTVAMIDKLVETVEDLGVMVLGSQGQEVLNPAVPELRQQQAALYRLLAALNLDAVAQGAVLQRAATVNAKNAASARWRNLKAVR